jgi:hypothetical protein
MNKKLLSLAVAGAFAASAAAYAQESGPSVSVNGFGNVLWKVTQDDVDTSIPSDLVGVVAPGPNESQFLTDGEVNFDSENLFIALAAATGGGNGNDSSVSVGQLFLKHAFNDQWMLAAGKFDSNLTADAGAAIDREFTYNSILFNGLAGEGGESLQGIALAGNLGMLDLNVGYVNDHSTEGTDDEKNSVAVRANAALMDDMLNLEFGYLSQDQLGGDIMDINGTFAFLENGIVGVDYLSLSDGDTSAFGVDDATSIWAGWNFAGGFAVKARYEIATPADSDIDDTTVMELYASYDLSENVKVAGDWRSLDDGDDTFDSATLQLVGAF